MCRPVDSSVYGRFYRRRMMSSGWLKMNVQILNHAYSLNGHLPTTGRKINVDNDTWCPSTATLPSGASGANLRNFCCIRALCVQFASARLCFRRPLRHDFGGRGRDVTTANLHDRYEVCRENALQVEQSRDNCFASTRVMVLRPPKRKSCNRSM